MRVLEAGIAALVTAILVTFAAHRVHVHVDLVTLWVITFLVMFITVLVLPYSSRDGGRR